MITASESEGSLRFIRPIHTRIDAGFDLNIDFTSILTSSKALLQKHENFRLQWPFFGPKKDLLILKIIGYCDNRLK